MRVLVGLLGLVVVVSSACRGRGAAEEAPRRWEEAARLTGPVERGYGAAVAWVGADIRVGAPWHGPGRVYDAAGAVVLEGVDGDRLGETLASGRSLAAGAPGRAGGGALVDESGEVLVAGPPGFGGAPLWHAGELVGLAPDTARGRTTSISYGEPVWSLASLAPAGPDSQAVLVAGRVAGGLLVAGRALPASGALGRGITACDVDQDGDDDLVLADPSTGRVDVHVIDDLSDLDLEMPQASFSLGRGAGRSLGCVFGGLWVGAPDLEDGGAIAWIRRPLEAGAEVEWTRGGGGSRLGHSLAVSGTEVLVGDPGRGEVRHLRPR